MKGREIYTKMEKKNLLPVLLGLGILIIVGFLVLNLNLERAQNVQQGGAPAGYKATVASTSELRIGTGATQVIATTTNCVSRILTTNNLSGIYLTFGNEANQTPTANSLGHYQPTTTQTLYDAATYGCGLWKAIGSAAATVTITEFTSFR